MPTPCMGCTSSKKYAPARDPSDKPEQEPSTKEESSTKPTKESPFQFASGLTDCVSCNPESYTVVAEVPNARLVEMRAPPGGEDNEWITGMTDCALRRRAEVLREAGRERRVDHRDDVHGAWRG